MSELEKKEVIGKIHEGIDYVLKTHKEHLDALAEFDRTGILKVKGEILYTKMHNI